ncbi:efflux transporter outer membrane subunit [Caulobacter endophyticus]|uniref:efflux transporter outer membrane subunit n=1 Tax=Caulobacter endophyticus TaxID=2172652 RepID=UPI00241021C8|nr:efflux transporter outer membrane subunit [Caulobacter endophyticus]MDG2529247.1 efflux transporter outer membrane subunit [Caulobacter endophyticus]
MRAADALLPLALLSLAACSTAPAYAPPAVSTPAAFRDTGPWTPASGADAAPAGDWWSVFADPTLAGLEQRLVAGNASLAQAVARYDQARALARQARTDLYPTVGVDAGAASQRTISSGRTDPVGLSASASYELDLWGRVRSQVEAGRADAQASAADLAAVRLSLQAQLADAYFQLRGADAQIAVLASTADAYRQALDLTRRRQVGGASSALDTGRAETQLATALAQQEQAKADRALLEHALAVLVGEPASSFSVASVEGLSDAPLTPVSTPSLVLQRRPDIAAAERRVAAANARIGVARAAWFPTVTLAASGGWQSTGGELLTTANRVWALGPAAAALPLLDGGARKAEVARSRAVFDEAAGGYRQTVLDAFREVEDQMALANRLAAAQARQDEAVNAAARTAALATTRYREGAASYLDVVTAQTAELDARRSALDLRTRRLAASVDLIRALGGGWTGGEGA